MMKLQGRNLDRYPIFLLLIWIWYCVPSSYNSTSPVFF